MLTEPQYAKFGRMSFEFNELEFILKESLANLLAIPEWSAAQVLAEQGSFSAQVHRFKKVLGKIKKERYALKKKIDAVLKLLDDAEEVSDERDKYIHALLREDSRTRQISLTTRKGDLPFDEEAIAKLTERIKDLAGELVEKAFVELYQALDEQRKLKKQVSV